MPLHRHVAWLAATLLAVAALCPNQALANPYDVSVLGLGRPIHDADAPTRWRSMTTELAFTLAPRALAPAETLGVSGFEMSIANSLTDITEAADYWKGQAGEPVFEAPLSGRKTPKMLWTPTLHLRKGLPLSTEIGIQGSYLSFSELFMVGAEFKIAIYESFFRWLPALALRVAGGRLFGSSQIDMLTGEADVMASLPFGVGGMCQVTPYVGFGEMFAHVNSYVIDETPYSVTDATNDQKGGTGGSLYGYDTLEWKNNYYPRAFGGLRMTWSMIELLFEYNLGIVRFTGHNVGTYSVKLGFDV